MTIKMFQISEETHSLFYSMKRKMEADQDTNLTVDEAIKELIIFWNNEHTQFPKEFQYKVRNLESDNSRE